MVAKRLGHLDISSLPDNREMYRLQISSWEWTTLGGSANQNLGSWHDVLSDVSVNREGHIALVARRHLPRSSSKFLLVVLQPSIGKSGYWEIAGSIPLPLSSEYIPPSSHVWFCEQEVLVFLCGTPRTSSIAKYRCVPDGNFKC